MAMQWTKICVPCHSIEKTLLDGPMKAFMMRGVECSLVSNATAASCEAKGCTYRGFHDGMNHSYVEGGGGEYFSSDGNESSSFGFSGGEFDDHSVYKNCSDVNCSDGGYSGGGFGGGGDGFGNFGDGGGGGGCEYSPTSADVAILMTAEIPGRLPVVGLLCGLHSRPCNRLIH